MRSFSEWGEEEGLDLCAFKGGRKEENWKYNYVERRKVLPLFVPFWNVVNWIPLFQAPIKSERQRKWSCFDTMKKVIFLFSFFFNLPQPFAASAAYVLQILVSICEWAISISLFFFFVHSVRKWFCRKPWRSENGPAVVVVVVALVRNWAPIKTSWFWMWLCFKKNIDLQ